VTETVTCGQRREGQKINCDVLTDNRTGKSSADNLKPAWRSVRLPIAPPFNWHDKDDMHLGEGAGTPDDDVGKA